MVRQSLLSVIKNKFIKFFNENILTLYHVT